MNKNRLLLVIFSILIVVIGIVHAALNNPNTDLNSDGIVDGTDLTSFLNAFGSNSQNPDYNQKSDFNDDGIIDGTDLTTFLSDFGKSVMSNQGDFTIRVISPTPDSVLENEETPLEITTDINSTCSYNVYVQTGQQTKPINLQDTSGITHSQQIQNLENNNHYLITVECSSEGKSASRIIPFSTEFRVIEGILSVATTKDDYPIGRQVELTDPPEPFIKTNIPIGKNDNVEYEKIISPFGEGYTFKEVETREGYIIQFKEEPLLAEEIKLREDLDESKDKRDEYKERAEESRLLKGYYNWRSSNLQEKTEEIREEMPEELKNHKDKIISQQKAALEDIEKRAPSITGYAVADPSEPNKKIKEVYTNVFNGVVLDVSDEEAEEIKKSRYVKDVYPNYKVKVNLDQSTPVIRIDESNEYYGVDGEDTVIAIIDTGIDPTHKSLDDLDDDPETDDPKVIAFKDYVNFRPEPYDDHGHGTHCAGIAAGTGGSSDYRGVAPKAKLVGVKVLDDWGSGSFSQVLAGIEWAVQNKDRYGINVISLSLGANINSDGTTPQEQAVDLAVDSGINVIVAAGNSGPAPNTVGVPASANKIITVGAIDNNMQIAGFSSRGPTKDGRIKPEVTAPGVDICSAQWEDAWDYSECADPDFVHISGTSMATPHVAGVVALLVDAVPSITPTEVKETLMNTAIDKGEVGPDNAYGWGVVDTLKALITLDPPQHDLALYDLEIPKWVNPNTQVNINVLLKNNGLNDEINVIVRLLINGAEQDSKTISTIASKTSQTTSFSWTPIEETDYDITMKVESVSGENIIGNNEQVGSIKVVYSAGTIKALILDSWCIEFAIDCNIYDVEENWYSFGDYTIQLETLGKENINYEDIANTGADVLIISDAWDDGGAIWWTTINWEFTDDEIGAIIRYVNEGHGIIGTGGTLSENVPNNIKLAPLFGIEQTIGLWNTREADFSGEFSAFYPEHPVFYDMDLPHYSRADHTVLNLKLDPTNPGDILAKSVDDKADIIAYRNSVYFTNMPELSSYEEDQHIIYNSILFASNPFIEQQQDLSLINMQVKDIMNYNSAYDINATLKNKGTTNEQNINLRFLVDGQEEDSIIIPSLNSGEEIPIRFTWTPLELGEHKIELVVDALPQETTIFDNSLTKDILVPSIILTGNYYDRGVDLDGDGLYNYLAIDVEVDVLEEGDYSVDFDLFSEFGAQITSGRKQGHFEKGKQNITVELSALDFITFGLNGPYRIINLGLYSNGKEFEFEEEFHQTYAYSYEQFQSSADLRFDNLDMPYKGPVGSFNVVAEIENIGSEVAKDVKVSVYQEEGYENYLLLKEIPLEDIEPSSTLEIDFMLEFNEIGYRNIIFAINTTNDANPDNNIDYRGVCVVANAPDVDGYIYYPESKVIIDEERIVEARITNEGLQKAEGITISLYLEEYNKDSDEATLTLIGTTEIESLEVDSSKDITFSWTPTEVGRQMLVLIINSTEDSNPDNNIHHRSFNVIPDAPDVLGYIEWEEKVLINQLNTIDVEVTNQGTQPAENVLAELYEENYVNRQNVLTLIDSKEIPLLDANDEIMLKLEWTPDEFGYKTLLLVVNSTDDGYPYNNKDYRQFRVTQRSMIHNTGTIDITGYLLMKVQKRDDDWNWDDFSTIVDDLSPRTIAPSKKLALDKVWAENGYYMPDEKGHFKVYVALRDQNGEVITTYDGTQLSDEFLFMIYD
ncbi:MAG: S8 family serine peptidase [Nanoarchaeota archaeon]|nr:S8 family serine peptidase [Nanoarchaeota archaeon]